MAKIFSLGICLLLLLSLFSWAKPVSAGICEWSAETIPTQLDSVLGPVGIDVRDFTIGNDSLAIYAVPGDSIGAGGNFTYKSTDGGVKWTELPVPIAADLIAVSPDDNNLVVIANTSTTNVYISFNGGLTWQTMGNVKDPAGGEAASAIYDIAVSPIKNSIQYIAVAGKEDTDIANLANLWYYDYGAVIQGWHETNTLNGFATDNETAAVTFSPGFSWDSTVAVVTDNASVTGGVRLQLLNISTRIWNDPAGYLDYPCAIVSANITRLTSASLALAPTFDGDDASSYKFFIGITVDGDATANGKSGIYRLVDIITTNILLNVKIHSIAYNGANLVAGTYDAATVYRSANPSTFFPTFNLSTATKSPSGDNRTMVVWLGSSVIAGTSGVESAFAKSADNGATFDDISLIDTTIFNARDVAVSRNGDKVYLVTDNGTNTSLWRLASDWKRVFCLKGTTDFIVRVDPLSASVIYLAQKNGTTIYHNNASGGTAWTARTCNINIQDIAVESTTVVYALNNTGSVAKSITSGASWIAPVPTTLGSGATIVSVSTNNLLVGSASGFVAYSTSGSTNWTIIQEAVTPAGGKVQVIADESFSTNKIIYAATDAPGGNIMRWTIGTSTSWTDIFNGALTGGIFGLAITDNILFALEYNAGTAQSTLWRHISPATAAAGSTEWSSSTTTTTTDINDLNVQLNAEPQALKASAGKLWAVKTNLTNKLYSYADVILDVSIDLVQPALGSIVRVNSLNGIAYDVMFSWERPSVASEYQLNIAYDKDFLFAVTTITVATNNTIACVLAGPQQVGLANINFSPGETYYWRIRTTKPGYSPYSVTKYFAIQPLLDASAMAIVANQNGRVTGTNPTLSWQPLEGTTEYQFRLSDNPEMTSPILDTKVKTTVITVNITLEYGKTYFWQVRAIKPNESNWSALVNFTVADKPSEPEPPVIIENVPPITVVIPPPYQEETTLLLPPTSVTTTEVTPAFLHVIIFTMAVLLVVVAFMIYGRSPKRLLAFAQRVKRPPVLTRKYKKPEARPKAPEAAPETRKEETKPPELPKKEAALPPAIEKIKEGDAVIFAAKSFIWMLGEEKGADETKAAQWEKERQFLGNKLAIRIRDLTKRENLYIKHPQDAAMLLGIWAQYGSSGEASRYLTKSFADRPDNAIRLLNCYLPAAQSGKPPPSADDFTMSQYNSLAEVVDPDKVYAAVAKVFKFKVEAIEEKIPVKPAERNLAFKFMRLHLQKKGGTQKT